MPYFFFFVLPTFYPLFCLITPQMVWSIVKKGAEPVYEIWHDNDFDLAHWFYLNSDLSGQEVVLRQIPKTNNSTDLLNHLKTAPKWRAYSPSGDLNPKASLCSPNV